MKKIWLVLVAMALVAAACGDDGDDTTAADSDGEATETTAAAADDSEASDEEATGDDEEQLTQCLDRHDEARVYPIRGVVLTLPGGGDILSRRLPEGRPKPSERWIHGA